MAADLDNLEYYIKFPNPNFNYQQNGDGDYVFVVNEDKIPVILLFGWAGCQDRYLAKYSKIYEDKGLITLRYTAPVKCLFWKHRQMIPIGEKLIKLLIDLNFENHPIIIHCFSNGGAFLYQNFHHALTKSPKPLPIKGVIFDSAPGKRRFISLYRALSVIFGNKKWYHPPLTMMITILLSMVWLLQIGISIINPKTKWLQDPFFNLLDEPNRWPQLFIYSKVDDLIPYEDIEYFSNYRKTLGVDVTTVCYEDSPHVKHYSKYRESYVNSICGFINKCLNGVN